MTTPGQWHVNHDLLARYAQGGLDHPRQAAVETHLTACAECQEVASGLVRAPALDKVWDGVRATIAVPPSPAVLRWLTRLGLPEPEAVILRASSALYRPWVLSVALAVVSAVGGAAVGPRYKDLLFLLAAPLIPVLAVAAAYDTTDPLRELTGPTPMSKLRIALLRAAAALSVAVPVTCAVGLVVPGLEDMAFTWLLPSLSLTVTALALLSWWRAWVTAGAVGAGWLVCVVGIFGAQPLRSLDSTAAHAAFVVVSVAMAAVLVTRTSPNRLHGGHS